MLTVLLHDRLRLLQRTDGPGQEGGGLRHGLRPWPRDADTRGGLAGVVVAGLEGGHQRVDGWAPL
jgi:hypothetical protein